MGNNAIFSYFLYTSNGICSIKIYIPIGFSNVILFCIMQYTCEFKPWGLSNFMASNQYF